MRFWKKAIRESQGWKCNTVHLHYVLHYTVRFAYFLHKKYQSMTLDLLHFLKRNVGYLKSKAGLAHHCQCKSFNCVCFADVKIERVTVSLSLSLENMVVLISCEMENHVIKRTVLVASLRIDGEFYTQIVCEHWSKVQTKKKCCGERVKEVWWINDKDVPGLVNSVMQYLLSIFCSRKYQIINNTNPVTELDPINW